MANIADSRPMKGVAMTAPKISARFWVRFLAGSLGALFCAVGAAVAVFPFPSLPNDYVLAKFALGVLLFFTGILIARSGNRAALGDGVRFLGVDLSGEMIALARRRAERAGACAASAMAYRSTRWA